MDLKPPYEDTLADAIKTEDDVDKFLLGSYLKMSSGSMYGANLFYMGDLLGDSFFRSNENKGGFANLIQMNYNPTNTGSVDFYRPAYDVIQSANFVIYNELEDTQMNKKYKAEASFLRAYSYFTLLNYYASSPKSGQFQEIGVPIAAYPYNPNEKIARSTVGDVYTLIINDLNYAITNAVEIPSSKIFASKVAAKLLLSRVYLTRQGAGDAELALKLSQEIVTLSESAKVGDPFKLLEDKKAYEDYFASNKDEVSENQPETVWELDIKTQNNPGVNVALGVFYSRTGASRSLLAKETFYKSIVTTDIRKDLMTVTGVPVTDNPLGVWIRKHERASSGGNYTRNTKILRISEAYLNQVEALYQLGKNEDALNALNNFAVNKRKGSPYTGTALLTDILNERNKEFFGEGQRFLDLKRYNLAMSRGTNCPGNCDVPANSKLFVMPFSLGQIIVNGNAVQHPLWK
ncbi:RagB/SusD family nutrient uptake outer membrane protein [Algoriella sp.]|uniref:RagB/SusD family nutrient uptake outer membrane protein n=1 Tax=Algoriella sp. TaxID=1872434 RepID=UPI001B1D4FB5|nr:RagB/SusD family nutrient uptake outer membrane protein [Algoriella sp.]MBO6211591.1 RagB/SusD family nutrient uptake outer membrane protein [Algoriella sp.]